MARKMAGLVFFLFFVFTGGYLPFVQGVAWVSMIRADLKHESLRAAIREAFEVDDHCHLCRFVQRSCLASGSSLIQRAGRVPLCDLLNPACPVCLLPAAAFERIRGQTRIPRAFGVSPPVRPPRFTT